MKSLLILTSFVTIISLAEAQIISNGSVEVNGFLQNGGATSEIGTGVYAVDPTPTASGWDFSPNNYGRLALGTTTDGAHSLHITSDWYYDDVLDTVIMERGWVAQDFTVPATGSYDLSFDSFGGVGIFEKNYEYDVSILDSTGAALTSWSYKENVTDSAATAHSESFTAAAGTPYTLRFLSTGGIAGTSSDAGNLFFDKVAITAPEPSAGLLVLMASAVFLKRRRR